jgi:excinuclease ABC subunit C
MKALDQKIQTLPTAPGVYLFLDERSKILYVGKAKNLRKRVAAYCRSGVDERVQIPSLLGRACDLQFLVTETEREALILENNLIKQNQPEYNLCLKDDKTFQSLMIQGTHPFPSLSIVRKYIPQKGNHYFGPFCNAQEVRAAYTLLLKLFRLRDCSDAFFKTRKKACLQYDLKLCSGPCVGHISKEEYGASVQAALAFLKGDSHPIFENLKNKIKVLSDQLAFEKAAEVHAQLQALEKIQADKNSVAGFTSDADVLGFCREGSALLFQVLIIRGGKMISADARFFKNKPGNIPELLRLFLEQYYTDCHRIPLELWLPRPPEDRKLLEEILSERRKGPCKIVLPKKGVKAKVLAMAQENAAWKLSQAVHEKMQTEVLLEKMQKSLHLKTMPKRIECYDVSHSAGKDSVGVKVSFWNLTKDTSQYRKFLIRSATQADDYQSLYEVLTRRVKRGIEDKDLPDLFLIDGGLGHLSVLQKVLEKYKLEKDGASIAKENHSKSSLDHVFILGRKNAIPLKPGDSVLLKCMEIRDEAHRFALRFHTSKREKRIFDVQ